MVVAIHYLSDYAKDYMERKSEYSCPSYCEVDHEHITKEVPNVSKSSNRYDKGK